jgi:hypothetical protein
LNDSGMMMMIGAIRKNRINPTMTRKV